MTAEPVTPAEIRPSPARGRHFPSPRAEFSPAPDRSKRRILLVDDDASVRESLGKVLRGAGYEVQLAADGAEALERFDPQRTDLLLLDVALPIMNGWEALERIAMESPTTPVIIITGQTDQFLVAAAAGVDALLEKPLDASRLLETIRRLLADPANPPPLCADHRRDVGSLPPQRALLLRKLREQYAAPFRCTRLGGNRGLNRIQGDGP